MHNFRLPFVIVLLSLVACTPDTETDPGPATAVEQSIGADGVDSPAGSGADANTLALEEFFSSFTDRWVEMSPDQAVASGYFSGETQNAMEQQLTPVTREFTLRRIELAEEGLDTLASLDLDGVDESLRQAADLMAWQLGTLVQGRPWLDYIDFRLQQMNGANVSLPNALTVVHPMIDPQDAENYVLRLGQVDDRMLEAVADNARRMEQGIVLPAFILRNTIAQMDSFIASPVSEHPLVTTFREKTTDMDELSPERRTALMSQVETIVSDEVYPAWREAIAELQRELPLATDDAGLWRFENGAEIYQQQLRAFTSTDLSADEIHEIGLAEVARIETEMELLFDQIGVTEGTILERTEQLKERTAYTNDDAGRAAMTADIQAMVTDALDRAESLFDTMPRTPVVAQPYPRFRWEAAAASYTVPPLDGSRPGVFQFPLRENELMSYDKRSLVYHETVPGHHFQMALLTENDSLPRFIQIRALGGISANSEGWALYAERLAAESGWYEDDIEGYLGYLNSMLFRARRLVVDTGIHAKGWTRQQAIDYGIAPSEVDRYTVWPGQACSYMVGQLKIVELRERMREALGEDFSISDFHNLVLGAGVIPLSMLEELVDEHIAAASD